MNTYVAKKVDLDTMRECQGRGCSCFTNQGYYIHYRKQNIDSMLFVCEDCFNSQYRTSTILGSFDTSEYLRQEKPQYARYSNQALRQLIKLVRDTTRGFIATSIFVALLLTVAYCIKEKPTFRSTYPSHTIYCNINSSWRGVDKVAERIAGLQDRIVHFRT